jgi:hypothetical protein
MGAWSCGSCGGENPEGTAFCGHCGAAVGSATSVRSAGIDVSDALRSFVAGPVADRLIESGGTISEERRLVTALFADVSGFTSLAERLDPEQSVVEPFFIVRLPPVNAIVLLDAAHVGKLKKRRTSVSLPRAKVGYPRPWFIVTARSCGNEAARWGGGSRSASCRQRNQQNRQQSGHRDTPHDRDSLD